MRSLSLIIPFILFACSTNGGQQVDSTPKQPQIPPEIQKMCDGKLHKTATQKLSEADNKALIQMLIPEVLNSGWHKSLVKKGDKLAITIQNLDNRSQLNPQAAKLMGLVAEKLANSAVLQPICLMPECDTASTNPHIDKEGELTANDIFTLELFEISKKEDPLKVYGLVGSVIDLNAGGKRWTDQACLLIQ